MNKYKSYIINSVIAFLIPFFITEYYNTKKENDVSFKKDIEKKVDEKLSLKEYNYRNKVMLEKYKELKNLMSKINNNLEKNYKLEQKIYYMLEKNKEDIKENKDKINKNITDIIKLRIKKNS